MQSLEIEFNRILSQYGNAVIVLRQNSKTKCSCYDEVMQSASRDCPYCFGLGVVPIAEKHLTRDMDVKVPDSLPYIGTQQLYGEMAVPGRAYFFKKDVAIRTNDLIVDVVWEGGRPVYTGNGIYQVSHVDPQRFERGEIVFQKVYVKDQPVQKELRGIKIVERFGQMFYQLALEGGPL